MVSATDNTASHAAQLGLIRRLGARATPARIAVLNVLENAERALSHHDVEEALADTPFDRVTLYRVLDWLEQVGLAHRTVDAQRVFRYSMALTSSSTHQSHAHFRCDDCGKVYCLEKIPVASPALPAGFSGNAVELSISGHCARCGKQRAGRKR